MTITSNGKFGIHLEGDGGSVATTVEGSTIASNTDVGLMIEEGLGNTTSEVIWSNDMWGKNVGGGYVVGGARQIKSDPEGRALHCSPLPSVNADGS